MTNATWRLKQQDVYADHCEYYCDWDWEMDHVSDVNTGPAACDLFLFCIMFYSFISFTLCKLCTIFIVNKNKLVQLCSRWAVHGHNSTSTIITTLLNGGSRILNKKKADVCWNSCYEFGVKANGVLGEQLYLSDTKRWLHSAQNVTHERPNK